MGENVDVRALRARFTSQQEIVTSGGGASPNLRALSQTSESSANGAVRNKQSPVSPRPVLPVTPTVDHKRFGQPLHGVFPRPPPSHRVVANEELKAPLTEPDTPGRVKLTGELLQNRMMKHIDERKIQSFPRPPLPSQRSMSEVAPLRKPLPPVGQRPSKPRRPPVVNLDHLRKKLPPFQTPRRQDTKTSEGPGRPPNKPVHLNLNKPSFSNKIIEHEQDTYDDIELPPPPPPPPKPSSRESWTDSFSSQADEESDQSEIYEHIEDQDDFSQPAFSEKKKQRELKRQQELEKKEQKERQKRENEYRKKFKLTGNVEVLHLARVREDWQGGKNDLCVQQGESVEIIRVSNNPEGKWLARNMIGEYGYINNRCVDVDYEAVKRKLCAAPLSFPPPVQEDEEVYDDVGADPLNSFTGGGEVYDDVEILDEFPLPPPEICHDPKKSKKLEKEEKEFRKKFKFEGPIKVLCCMMVDPNANIKKCGGKDLNVTRGEILEVIQETSEKKVLCRNDQGKYGYVPRSYLLHAESEIYDDIDNLTDVYDNDGSTSGPLRP
ncbi:FYN-binding protein 1 isoform X2 [Hoplias malabaricus]|uniref:FYN-binding protein 1 isoform X2 n=1 Tax=Hoplias malabaricus TaxID=27720 RepID=UPI003461BC6F